MYGDVYIVLNEDNAWYVYVKDYNNVPGDDRWIDSGMKIDFNLYAEKTYVSNNYIPKSEQNNFLTVDSLNGYATRTWVTGQGYITASTLSNYVLSSYLTTNFYNKAQSDTRYIIKSQLAGTGNRLLQALPDGTVGAVTVNSLPPDRVLGYDSLNRVTAFTAKPLKSTWVDSTPPTLTDLNELGTEMVDAPNVGTGRLYILCDTIWTYVNLTIVT